MGRRHEHGEAGAAVEIVAAQVVVTEPPWRLSVAGDDDPSSGSNTALCQRLGIQHRLHPHRFPRQSAALLQGGSRAFRHVLGADGEHSGKALLADEDLHRSLTDRPWVQAAHRAHAKTSIGIDPFNDHADLVLVGDDGDASLRRSPLEVNDDAVGVVLPNVVPQVAKHLQQQALDFGLRPGGGVSVGQAFEIGEQTGTVDGHGNPFGQEECGSVAEKDRAGRLREQLPAHGRRSAIGSRR
ncbi:MAG: hypothetical protein VCF24_17235 [Candidatus Latescibacterota bacterium]